MRVFEILFEAGADYKISTQDMEQVFPYVAKRQLDSRDVKNLANEIADAGGFSRTPGSAQFIINRMHVLIHGMVPTGYTERSAERMFSPARPLIDFVRSKGIEMPEENIRRARIEMKSRKPKITQEQATKEMAASARNLPPEDLKILKPLRNEIIADIMAGLTAEEAFQRRL